MPKKVWMRDPDGGGVKIPPAVKARTEQRILRYAEEHYEDKYIRLEVRFRGQFCYIDAYTEPSSPGYIRPRSGWSSCAIPPPTCAGCATSATSTDEAIGPPFT